MIKNYFKIAWRNLLRHKQMTTINILGLGIGMAAAVLIALWVQNELSYDQYEPDANNIYRITANIGISPTETWIWETSQYVLGTYAAKELPEIEDLARISPQYYSDVLFHYNGSIISEKKAAYVDEHWFNMFHYDFTEGSPDAFLKNPFSIILTESTAKKYFGNQDAVGKIMRIDTNNYQVQAIVKDAPANSSFQYNVLMPVAAQFADAKSKKNALEWGNYNYITFLKLKPGSNTKSVSAKLLSIMQHNRKGDKGNASFRLVSLKDMHFESDLMHSAFLHGNKTIVDIFIVLAFLLLVTACINYVNLTTARASIRSKEVSIRKIVGADRVHLFGQFMSESFLVSLLSLVFALLLVQLTLPWFRLFTEKAFVEPLTSPLVWGIVLATLLVSFLLNGIYPATLLSSFKPLNIIRGKNILNFKDVGLRKALVVLQFTISVVLIIGTIVIYAQLRYIQKMDPGYNRSQVFTFTIPWKILGWDEKKSEAKINTIKQDLLQSGAIADVTSASDKLVDFKSQSAGGFDWNGRPKEFNPSLSPLRVDPGFKQMMQLKIKEGRWFNNDLSDKHNVLLNETAVEVLNIRKPIIGQRFIHQGDTGVIIGIVKDFHYRSLHEKIGALLISNQASGCIYIKTTPGNNQAAITAAQKVWQKFVPDEPFNYDFLDDTYNNLYKAEQQSSVLITMFAIIAVLVSALGLLGLSAFTAEQKVKEIGIRKVLGASIQSIVSLLSIDFLKMVLIACVIAFPIAWWGMNKWLESFAYRVSVYWWILALASVIALLIAFVTISFQSFKAAAANPVKSLRSE